MRVATILAVILAAGSWTTAAAADDTPDVVKKNGVYELKTTIVKARPPRPAVAIDVARVVQRAPLPELRQPLVERIGKAVDAAPF